MRILGLQLQFTNRSHPQTSFGFKMALLASGRRQTKAALAAAKADLFLWQRQIVLIFNHKAGFGMASRQAQPEATTCRTSTNSQ